MFPLPFAAIIPKRILQRTSTNSHFDYFINYIFHFFLSHFSLSLSFSLAHPKVLYANLNSAAIISSMKLKSKTETKQTEIKREIMFTSFSGWCGERNKSNFFFFPSCKPHSLALSLTVSPIANLSYLFLAARDRVRLTSQHSVN
jgi:hypothetical protein